MPVLLAIALVLSSLTNSLVRAGELILKARAGQSAPATPDAPDKPADEDADDPDPDLLAPRPPRPPPIPGGKPGPASRSYSVHTKDAPAVDVLHRIAQAAGWTLVVTDLGDETVSLDVERVDPREAVRAALKSAKAWGVLHGNELVVLPAGDDSARAGELVEAPARRSRSSARSEQDLVHVMQGDLTIRRGTVVKGDAVVVGGNLNVEAGGLVQGAAVSVLGNVNVEQGGLVLGDGVAVLGTLDIDQGGQVLGEQVNVGVDRLFGHRHAHHRGFFDRLGLFGFFPTLALFALIYLVGLFVLVLSPDRLRGISATLLGHPMRSFAVGFLSWLLVVPVAVLLCVTLVGIPLLPLLPLVLFLSFALGLAAIALRIGELLPAGPGQKFVPTAALGMGTVVLALVAFVPLIGLPVLALVQFAAVGAVIGSRAGKPAGAAAL